MSKPVEGPSGKQDHVTEEVDVQNLTGKSTKISKSTAEKIIKSKPVWVSSVQAAPKRIPLIAGLFDLLILDEVFDGSLDEDGTGDFLKILHSLGNDSNVFVISHKGEVLYDKFKNMIKFEKHKNFSRIV